jgi:hypothetical protein
MGNEVNEDNKALKLIASLELGNKKELMDFH